MRGNSRPQGVGGRNADARFPPVPQVHGAPDEGYHLGEVEDVVSEFQEHLHFSVDFQGVGVG